MHKKISKINNHQIFTNMWERKYKQVNDSPLVPTNWIQAGMQSPFELIWECFTLVFSLSDSNNIVLDFKMRFFFIVYVSVSFKKITVSFLSERTVI